MEERMFKRTLRFRDGSILARHTVIMRGSTLVGTVYHSRSRLRESDRIIIRQHLRPHPTLKCLYVPQLVVFIRAASTGLLKQIEKYSLGFYKMGWSRASLESCVPN